MHIKNIFLSLLITFICIPNAQSMQCIAKKFSFNHIHQQARHITGVEVGGIAVFCLLGFFAHANIPIGNTFDPDFTLNRAPSMKDYYAEVAKIAGSSCSKVHEKNNPRGCCGLFCRYDGAHASNDGARKADYARYLKALDETKNGRLTHLLLLQADIARLHDVEKEANYALMWAEQSPEQQECQRVLRLIAHVRSCLLHEVCIIEEDMPNYVHKKRQENEQELSDIIKKCKLTNQCSPQKLISAPETNKE